MGFTKYVICAIVEQTLTDTQIRTAFDYKGRNRLGVSSHIPYYIICTYKCSYPGGILHEIRSAAALINSLRVDTLLDGRHRLGHAFVELGIIWNWKEVGWKGIVMSFKTALGNVIRRGN